MRSKLFPFFLFAFCFLILASHVLAADEEPATLNQLTDIFGRAISVVALIGGFLSFIALIVGGFRYITARGDPKAIAAAQSSITWAIAGLGLIIVAWLILVFIEKFTGVQVTTFRLAI